MYEKLLRCVMDYKKYIAEKIKIEGVSAEEIAGAIAVPPNSDMGDYALPCFKFAKILRQSPVAIAQKLAAEIQPDGVIAWDSLEKRQPAVRPGRPQCQSFR